jgi:hypothetical protein
MSLIKTEQEKTCIEYLVSKCAVQRAIDDSANEVIQIFTSIVPSEDWNTQSSKMMTIALRNAVSSFLIAKGFRQEAQRLPYITSTRQEIVHKVFSLLDIPAAHVPGSEKEEDLLPSTLGRLRQTQAAPVWNATLEHFMHTYRSEMQEKKKTDSEWNLVINEFCNTYRAACKNTESIFPEQLLLLLSDPEWRLSTKFSPPTECLKGQACHLREILRWNNLNPDLKSFFDAEKVLEPPTAPADLLLLMEDKTCFVLDWEFKQPVEIIAYPEFLDTSSCFCAVPGTSTLFYLQRGEKESVEWTLQAATYSTDTDQWVQESLPFQITFEKEQTYMDCAITQQGVLVLQIGERNSTTGAVKTTECFSFTGKFIPYELNPQELKEIEERDAEVLHSAKNLDFRDHNSILSLQVTKMGSLVCFSTMPVLRSPELLASALGCPQEFVTVSCIGTVQKYKFGVATEKVVLNKPVAKAILFTKV